MDIKRKTNNHFSEKNHLISKTSNKKRRFFNIKKPKINLKFNIKNLFNTKRKRLIFSIILILLVIAPLSFYFWKKSAQANWWNSDWNYRRSITINSAQIPADLTNYPMLVSFTDGNLINKAQSDGGDIIFIEENGNRLDHEIEKFDSTTGELVAWVRIPQLEGDYDTNLYVYYGNQTVDNQQRPEDVWDDNFKTIQHLEEGGTGARYDSTRINTDAITQNFSGDESISAAKINGGDDLEDDDNTYFDLGTPEALNISQQITLSAWVRVESDNNSRIISKSGASSNLGYILSRRAAVDSFEFSISTNGTNWDTSYSNSVFNTGTWYYVVGTYDGTTKRMFINGSEESNATLPKVLGANMNISTVSTQIGRDEGYGNDGYIFDGIIDEVRISNSARSANWITTEYNNQNSPSTFISLGQEEQGPSPALYLPFDEGFGTTAHDETSNHNDGNIVGATWKDESMCKNGKCLEFDGTGDYVEISDNKSLDLSEEVTLEAWVKPTSTTPENQTIISKEETPTEPTKIYRSVGPGAPSAIVQGITEGGTNSMNITGDRATFATALPDNVGVGDVIQYDDDDDSDIDTNDSLAFIIERISNKEYRISNASGANPTPINSDNNWSLFRAYTSLANAESGIENTGIDSDLRNFDDWTAGGDATTDDVGKDLVAANQQWNIACYANGTTADTALITITGWNTGKDNFINIYTPISSSEVGVSQRHSGKWDNSKYHLDLVSVGARVILIYESFVNFDGLQVFLTANNTNGANALETISLDLSSGSYLLFANNIIKASLIGTAQNSRAITQTTAGAIAVIYNNIIYNFSNSSYGNVGIQNSGIGYIYNNTVTKTARCYIGTAGSDSIFKNNIAQDCSSSYDYSGTINVNFFTNNLTSNTPSASNAFGVTYTTGTTNGTTASKLINSGETFITKGVQIGSIIKNTTDNTYTYVTALDSETQLSVANDIFVSGEGYNIYTNKYGTASFISTTAGSEDFHLSPTDTAAKDSGADLSVDSVFPMATDIDGQQRLYLPNGGPNSDDTKWDIGADEARATQIYRSVSPEKTDALEIGTENTMTIGPASNGVITATFQRALADNVGVGDVIQYDDDNDGDIDTNDSLAFIVGRISSFEFQISNASGGTPTEVINDNDWSLFRAYTSLANAENGDENTGIDSDLRNFDSWTGGKDLVASKEQWNIICYANGINADTARPVVEGWTTGIINYINIEANENDKAELMGWGSDRYILEVSNSFSVKEDYVRINGLQIYISSSSTGITGISVEGYSVNSDVRILNCRIRGSNVGANPVIGIYSGGISGSNLKIFNNIIEDLIPASSYGRGLQSNGSANIEIYNNIFYNISDTGIVQYNETPIIDVKNTIVFNTPNDFSENAYFTIDHCASDDGTGTNVVIPSDWNNVFMDYVNGDFRLKPTGTDLRNIGIDLSAEGFNTDMDGNIRDASSSAWDIGPNESKATKIYRSVGPGNTNALATDESHENTLSVTSGIATFEVDLPDRIGVGDAVIIDTGGTANAIDASDTLLFIHGRNSSVSYDLRTHTGAMPTDIASNDTYQIFRAYTSLANAEAGTKNTSIPVTFNGGNRDLVTNNEEWNIACYGDGVDITNVRVVDWITGVQNFINIYTPTSINEVGISQRHDGKWNIGKYRLEITSIVDYHSALQVDEDFVKIDGLQIFLNSQGYSWCYGVLPYTGLNPGSKTYISNNIIRGLNSGATSADASGIFLFDADGEYYIYNNIIYDFNGNTGVTKGTGIYSDGVNSYIYNNTVYNCIYGYDRGWSGAVYVYMRNNIAQNCTDGFLGLANSLIDFNISDLASDAPGTNSKNSTTVTFRDAANKDFRLAMADTAAKGSGINLSNDINLPFSTDIEGELRPSLRQGYGVAMSSSLNTNYLIQNTAFDIGADQISTTTHNNYSLNLKTNYPQANFSTGENDRENFSSGDITLNPNEWSHIVYKRSNDAEELYLNGSKKDSKSISNFLKTNNGKLYLGSKDTNSKNSFKGFLDEVRIYPYARTEDEIKKDKTQGSSGRAASRAQEGISVSMGDQANNLSDGLVGYWKMDESSWTGAVNEVKDASGNNNHGTAGGGATTAGGRFGNGGSFDGVDDYADVNTPFSSSEGTISLWVKKTENSRIDPLIYIGDSGTNNNLFYITYSSVNNDYIILNKDTADNYRASYNQGDSTGVWQHIVFTVNSLGNNFYVDGKKVSLSYTNGSSVNTEWFDDLGGLDKIRIGGDSIASPSAFKGNLDEVRIYNRALSPDEIQQLYNYAPGPVLHLKMDEKTGTTAFDSSGNGNNGIISNASWVEGKHGSALRFNGNNSVVNAGSNSNLDNLSTFTYSAWIKPEGEHGHSFGTIAFKGNGSSMMKNFRVTTPGPSSNQRRVGLTVYTGGTNAASYTANDSYDLNKWDYWTISYDDFGDRKAVIYKNGIKVSTYSTQDAGTGSLLDDAAYNMLIGSDSSGSPFYTFNGLIDDVKIYNYARTQEQIIEDMNAQEVSITGGEGNALNKPILDLNFNEGYGNIAHDASGNGNDATLNAGVSPNNTTTTAMWDKGGKEGGAMEFDGDDYVDVGSASVVDGLQTLSISAWVYPTADGSSNRRDIIGKDYSSSSPYGSWGIERNQENKFIFNVDNDGYNPISSINSFSNNQWHHVALIISPSVMKGYVNGVQEASFIRTTNMRYDPVKKIIIGSWGSGLGDPSQYWIGLIDDVKIYNYALSEDEIKTLYNGSSAMAMGSDESRNNNGTEVTGANKDYCVPGDTAKCDKPVLELKMDEKSGTTANDSSGNGNNGGLYGNTFWERGRINGGLKLDGTDDYIRTASSPLATSQNDGFTGSIWANLDRNNPGYIWELGGSDSFDLNWAESGAGDVFCRIRDSVPNYFVTPPINVSGEGWHYFSCVLDQDRDELILYVDGVRRSSASTATFNNNLFSIGPLNIGARGDYGGIGATGGVVDELKFYEYARTPAQIAWDYNRGKAINHWKFDEGSGSTVHDEGMNRNDGTITGATWKNEGDCKTGKCLYFDGVDTTRVQANTQNAMNSFSACAWVKASAYTNADNDASMSIFHKFWRLEILNSGLLKFEIAMQSGGYPTFITSNPIPLNEWHRICGVHYAIGTSPEIFMDGIKQTPSVQIGGSGTRYDESGSDLYIGSTSNIWGGNFNGYIDDPKIYNYALTAEQVKQEYNGGAVNFK